MPSKKRKTTKEINDASPVKQQKGKSSTSKVTRATLSTPKSSSKSKTADDKPVYTHWLLKSEPESRLENGVDVKFSFDDLKERSDQTEHWDGVRNYQARNFLRDDIRVGHEAFFYHSNCKEPGIIGICQVVKNGYPDHTQFEKRDPHFDSSSKPDNPKWYMVDVKYKDALKRYVPLSELKKVHQEHVKTGGSLRNMSLFTRARLSVQPVTDEEWDFILQLSEQQP